ncbi:MAG: lysophospholipid acyltransferase family protein [Terracidiphilus sp.]|jgi:1-acyl-sn-glycerol-3-phosphate acyltransferase
MVIAFNIAYYWLLRLKGPLTMERRALWLQSTCKCILKGAGIRYQVEGAPPKHGLVVANHLSYLDVLILSAAMSCFFIAKKEIRRWPIFGKAASMSGTIFIDRSSLASAQSVAAQMVERLREPVPVLLFPEGTSTDGSSVLRFHSRLIDPAMKAGVPITAAAVRYVTDDGTPERELCWYGDDTFVTHLMKVLDVAGFSARVRFGEPHIYHDRRLASDETHAEVTRMRMELTLH